MVLLEGLCNTGKLSSEDDQLELRYMDELLSIEKNIGPIAGAIGLQFTYEPETQNQEDAQYEEFKAEAQVEKKQNAEDGGDGGSNDGENAAAEGEGAAAKATAFKVEDHQWSMTNRQPHNLPQLFMKLKAGAIHEMKPADQFSSSQYEAISKSLDEFCQRISSKTGQAIYQQVIFTE